MPHQDVLYSGLKRAGYRLGSVGKWHVNDALDPTAFGCDRYVPLGAYRAYREKIGLPMKAESSNYLVPLAATDSVPVEQSRPHFLADRCIEILEEFAGSDDPFFLRLDFHGPHHPMVVPEPYASMYNAGSIPPWPNYDDPLDEKPAVQRIKARHWGTDRMTWEDWQPLVAKYFGEISLLDYEMGRVLNRLDGLGLAENTLVVVTSDHGDTMGAHKIWNKDYTMYEENYRVPFVVRWPSVIAPASVCNEYTIHFLDLTPTLLEVAGAPLPDGLHGRSLRPCFEADGTTRPRRAFCEFHGCHMGLYSIRSVRTDRFKYVFNPNDIDELYDLKNDPYEMENRAELSETRETLIEMRKLMVEEMKRTEDHLYNEWVVYWLTGDMHEATAAPGRTRSTW